MEHTPISLSLPHGRAPAELECMELAELGRSLPDLKPSRQWLGLDFTCTTLLVGETGPGVFPMWERYLFATGGMLRHAGTIAARTTRRGVKLPRAQRAATPSRHPCRWTQKRSITWRDSGWGAGERGPGAASAQPLSPCVKAGGVVAPRSQRGKRQGCRWPLDGGWFWTTRTHGSPANPCPPTAR